MKKGGLRVLQFTFCTAFQLLLLVLLLLVLLFPSVRIQILFFIFRLMRYTFRHLLILLFCFSAAAAAAAVGGAASFCMYSLQNFLFHLPFEEIYRRLPFFTLGRSVSA